MKTMKTKLIVSQYIEYRAVYIIDGDLTILSDDDIVEILADSDHVSRECMEFEEQILTIELVP